MKRVFVLLVWTPLALVLALAGPVAARTPARALEPVHPVVHGADRVAEIQFPLILRIGLEEQQESVTATCPRTYRVTYGDQERTAAAGQRWSFRIVEGQSAEIEYSVGIRTMEWGDLAEAEKLAASWRARGFREARVSPAGALLMHGGRIVHDNRRYYVVVRATSDRALAEKVQKELLAMGERPFFIERLVQESRGIIEARGPDGTPVVSRGPFEIDSGDRVRVFQVEHGVGYPWHGREDRDYAGSIILMVDRWGKLVVINRVEFEKYLLGVVPCEIEADAPLEAQKTQAISARGEALAGYGVRHPADPYDFDATQRDQVYGGITKETPLATQACLATRGEVLKSGDKIAETVYSANCGGHTEDNEAVWTSPVDPHLRAVPDAKGGVVPSPVTEANVAAYLASSPEAYCRDPRDTPTNKFRWKQTISAKELDRLVAAAGHAIGEVQALVPLSRGRSGRLRSLEIVGSKGKVRVDKELPIRQLLGGLRSALFVVRPGPIADGRPSHFVFAGGGWGHGVGMCQMGARGMARAGKPCEQILTHYFTGATLTKLYP